MKRDKIEKRKLTKDKKGHGNIEALPKKIKKKKEKCLTIQKDGGRGIKGDKPEKDFNDSFC